VDIVVARSLQRAQHLGVERLQVDILDGTPVDAKVLGYLVLAEP